MLQCTLLFTTQTRIDKQFKYVYLRARHNYIESPTQYFSFARNNNYRSKYTIAAPCWTQTSLKHMTMNIMHLDAYIYRPEVQNSETFPK